MRKNLQTAGVEVDQEFVSLRSIGLVFRIPDIRTVEIPCPTCPTWSQFIQDKLKISIYLSLDKYKFMFKVNTILYFIF